MSTLIEQVYNLCNVGVNDIIISKVSRKLVDECICEDMYHAMKITQSMNLHIYDTNDEVILSTVNAISMNLILKYNVLREYMEPHEALEILQIHASKIALTGTTND